jgi:hypothetical protein
MTLIGGQDGIKAYTDWLRKQPGVPQRGPGYNPDDLATWPWIDKITRTLQILKDDHDASSSGGGQPPNPIPPTTFECGVFVAGGAGSNMTDPDSPSPDKGSDYNGRPWTPQQACDAFTGSGYTSALVQLYREQGADYMACGRARGMKVGLWDAWPSASRAELALSFAPDMYCAQAETGQGQAAMDAIGRAYQLRPDLPLAIVTNLEPSRTMGATFDVYMEERGVICMVEAYANENTAWSDNPRGFVDTLVSEAHGRGYQTVVPVIGVYWGWTVAQYDMGDDPYYPYLAEAMSHAELS